MFIQISSTAYYILQMLAISHGLGQHVQLVSMDNVSYLLRVQFFMAHSFLWGISFIKISFILTILRFTIIKRLRMLLYGLIAFIALMGSVATFNEYFRCRPLRA